VTLMVGQSWRTAHQNPWPSLAESCRPSPGYVQGMILRHPFFQRNVVTYIPYPWHREVYPTSFGGDK
jgi:hypothetical protein